MKIFNWLLGTKSKPEGTVEGFAEQAIQAPASITVRISEFSQVVDALREALVKAYPNLSTREAFSHATAGLSLRCPTCGQFSDQTLSAILVAGTGIMKNAVFGGPNVAALARGRCPGCGGSTVIATFSPQKVKAQAEVAKAAAAATQGMPTLTQVCPGVPFYGSLAVSPDESLVCMVAPAGAVVAYQSGTNQQKWSLPVPSAKASLCAFVGPERLLVLSEEEKDQTLVRLVDVNNGSVLTEVPGVKAEYYFYGNADTKTGMFVGKSDYHTVLTIQTSGDKLEISACKCGQICAPGPVIGIDGKCYVNLGYNVSRIEDDTAHRVLGDIGGGNSICFEEPATLYCGTGYWDRSGESALHILDLNTGTTSTIPWDHEPVDEIARAGSGRLLLANRIDDRTMARYPNAVVTLLTVAQQKKEWSLTISDLKPWRRVILACAPEEDWALIQTGAAATLVAIESGKTLRVLPKQPLEEMGAQWLPTKKLLYINRSPDSDKPGKLECYSL